jgi:DTW domain-containing protein YfiP
MKKKVTKKVFWLEIEPYAQQCIIVVNGEFKDAYKMFKRANTPNARVIVKHIEDDKEYFDPKPDENQGSLYTELPCGYVMMIREDKDSWIATVGNIVHESTHLSHYILRRAGIDTLNRETEEAYTYLVERIVEKILAKIY